MSPAISFKEVSKHYRGSTPYRALRDDIAARGRRLLGRRHQEPEPVRALEEVSFEVAEGSAVALMGPNGSGKTTALKLISRITYPTAGTIRVAGRVGALIEVGTGLHPELSGRENIQLYGRILGLSGQEITRRFDDVVEFAELGHAIDQPVKQYSSGMLLRLGFSLASHVEPEVLLIDEAMSVGDVAFQVRCVERVEELRKLGITLVFVSHIPALVAQVCERGILLDQGRVEMSGSAGDVIGGYMELMSRPSEAEARGESKISVRSWTCQVHPSGATALGNLDISVELDAHEPVRDPWVGIGISDRATGMLVMCSMFHDRFRAGELSGRVIVRCRMKDVPLEPGDYGVWLGILASNGEGYLIEPRLLGHASLQSGPDATAGLPFVATVGSVRVEHDWHIEPC